jgi:ubiquinone/menaquinone biosynthesis C-methylase UbiE
MTIKAESKAMASVFAAANAEELSKRYADWAETYDAENAAAGFRMPQLCGAFFARHVSVDSKPILDAGCGTGAAGDCLRVLGYQNIVGVDLSDAMMARAERTGAYAALRTMVLGEPLDFPDDCFAAAIISGVFTEGHAPPSSFDELIRVCRPGAHLVFNVRQDVYENDGFRERQDALEREGRWRLREASKPFRPFTIKEPDIRATIFVYQLAPSQ